MPTGRNKHQSRECRARVREVLMQEWDPTGVRDESAVQDEYDRYAAKAYVILMDERATAPAIAAYLFEIAMDHMGLTARPELAERSAHTAETLVGLRLQFETH